MNNACALFHWIPCVYGGFEVFMAVYPKMAVFWVVSSQVDVYQHFKGPCCCHLWTHHHEKFLQVQTLVSKKYWILRGVYCDLCWLSWNDLYLHCSIISLHPLQPVNYEPEPTIRSYKPPAQPSPPLESEWMKSPTSTSSWEMAFKKQSSVTPKDSLELLSNPIFLQSYFKQEL